MFKKVGTKPDMQRCITFYRDGADSRAYPELAVWLQANPDIARLARQQAELETHIKRRFDPVLDEAIPPRLLRRRSLPVPAISGALVTLIVVAAAIMGWHQFNSPNHSSAARASAQAKPSAHMVDTLIALQPDLSAQGYRLTSSHIVRQGSQPVVEYQYTNQHGARIRVFAQPRGHNTHSANTPATGGFAQWRSPTADYVMVGSVSPHSLHTLARTAKTSLHQPRLQREPFTNGLTAQAPKTPTPTQQATVDQPVQPVTQDARLSVQPVRPVNTEVMTN